MEYVLVFLFVCGWPLYWVLHWLATLVFGERTEPPRGPGEW